MRIFILAVVLLLGVGLAYLFFWPVAIEPVAWQAPPAPSLEGPYAPNSALAAVERIGANAGIGPEDVDVDAQGRIYGGFADGRILRFDAQGLNPEELANTGGRPLGIDLTPDGTLVIADAKQGLLALRSNGSIRVLSTEAGGLPYKFTDDVDVGSDGAIYFSDASSKYGYHQLIEDVLEHGGHGRLLKYEPIADEVTVLLDGINFANGVALCPAGDAVFVNEMTSYRVLRHWLTGPKVGQHDVLIDNLPGMPDGISCSDNGVLWVAIVTPRDATVDWMADKPWLRKVVLRLPAAMHPKAARHGFVLGFDQNGKLLHNLQDASPGAFAPITSVEQRGDMLYLGSWTAPSMGRIKAP